MSKKIDIELALKEGRFGDLIRYLETRIDLLSQAVACVIKNDVKAKNPKGKVKHYANHGSYEGHGDALRSNSKKSAEKGH